MMYSVMPCKASDVFLQATVTVFVITVLVAVLTERGTVAGFKRSHVYVFIVIGYAVVRYALRCSVKVAL